MSDSSTEDYPRFGVLFVAGFADQGPGTAVASLAGALYGWFFRWNEGTRPGEHRQPTLTSATLASAGGDGPAHVTLTVPVNLPDNNVDTGDDEARWLLAESSWASVFSPPKFLGVARWIWKVSTCLLVLQFLIPMRRHWYRSKRADKPWHRRLADRIMVGCYLPLMAVAAMASVLLSLALLVLAVLEKLPIPRIDKAVRWVAINISALIGDSYMLAHCPVQFAAMCTQVADDLRWLQERCERVVIVAHSQGAAIAHQVLKDASGKTDDNAGLTGVRGFITIGQGISKFNVLWRMDWHPGASKSAWWSRFFVTKGMVLAGLPALGLLVRHWISTTIVRNLVSLPFDVVLPVVGFTVIASGVFIAIHVICDKPECEPTLPYDEFWWSDYYASADPVSNGPFVSNSGETRQGDGLPDSCNQVYNSSSILFDHNRYLRNQDQLLPKLINDLSAAAYSDSFRGADIVGCDVLDKVRTRRHRLVLSLISTRIVMVGLAVGLWQLNLGPVLKDPMNRLVDLLAPHTAMGDGFVRFLAAVIITVVVYLAVVAIWRIAEGRVMTRFFDTAHQAAANELPRPSGPAASCETSVPVG
jgi:hypothetical protein